MKRHTDFQRGAVCAASIAAGYPTTHEYRLDDCILGKLNIRGPKPRKNKKKLQTPEAAFLHGVAVALAESYRINGNETTAREVADNLGLTIQSAKASGADRFDLHALRRAGVK